ncbi:hypothetical protein SBV1_60044 [Verrucomicrobia bacterium]|nr:hypothetical protein SBV1_60044 [Verrucomicrobiota bacterium]
MPKNWPPCQSFSVFFLNIFSCSNLLKIPVFNVNLRFVKTLGAAKSKNLGQKGSLFLPFEPQKRPGGRKNLTPTSQKP